MAKNNKVRKSKPKPRLLVVDADKDVLDILCRVIEEDGYFDAHCYLSEADAWKYLADFGPPDVILADVPTVKIRFVKMMNTQEIPFILMSPSASKLYAKFKIRRVKTKVVNKPFDIYAVLSILTKLSTP